MMNVLIKNRKYLLAVAIFGFLLSIYTIPQSPGSESELISELKFTGSSVLTHLPLFLFLLTEAFGPKAETRSRLNRIIAWFFVILSGLATLVMLVGFLRSLFALLGVD
ncbi:MAG: hypothetical protein GY703_25065 [Gammaproteobacteria bacterium]|nr:hypothetical protein [Gammaproteobacteria bacterium]